MRWGFGWELGPFELIDAIGIERLLDAVRETNPDLLRGPAKPDTPYTRKWGNAPATYRRSAETRRSFAADRRAPPPRQTSRFCAAQKRSASSRRMRAPAWWISATVFSASSSTQR